MERTLIDLKTFNDNLCALAAQVADGDLAPEKRKEAEQYLQHFINDFTFAHEGRDVAIPKLVERMIQKDFVYPIL